MSGGQSSVNAGTAPRFRTTREVPAGAPIHQSLVNPVLIMGMERKPAISLLTTVAALFLGPGIHIYTFAWATLLLLVGTYALSKLAQTDPQMDDVLVRYSTYDRIYDPEAPADVLKPWWRFWETTSALAGPLRPAVPTPKEI
jgi:type IV secretory pathway TrbD component